MNSRKYLVCLASLLVPACGGSQAAPDPPQKTDAGQAGPNDAGAPDTGPAPIDASVDTGPVDATPADAGADVGTPDAGADVGSAACHYPAGPYGVDVGKVLDPTLQWQAWAPGASSPSTLSIADLYDCDGKKGINALVIDTSAQWCVACQYTALNIPDWMSSTGPDPGNWAALGVQLLTLIIQTNSYEPATINTAEQWRDAYKLTSVYVAADPIGTFPANSIPHTVLVNPRTMTVTLNMDNDSWDAAVPNDDAATAFSPDPAVATMAKANKK